MLEAELVPDVEGRKVWWARVTQLIGMPLVA